MYENRKAAGVALARALSSCSLRDPVVLALPRGGLPVALPVARAFGAPLDLILVRKIGVPGQPELAAGAIVDGPPEEIFLNTDLMSAFGLCRSDLDATIETKRRELAERRALYRDGAEPVPVGGRDAIVIDDGIATGATVRAALMALRRRRPRRIVLAVPVAPADTLETLRPLVDLLVCPDVPGYFRAVGLHYRDFAQVPDEAVRAIMAAARDGTEY